MIDFDLQKQKHLFHFILCYSFYSYKQKKKGVSYYEDKQNQKNYYYNADGNHGN